MNDVGDASGTMQILESFYNHLHETAGLATADAQNLQTFNFKVKYLGRDSNAVEKQAFGMLDFPVYLITTSDPSPLTPDEGRTILEAHKIPEHIILKKFDINDSEIFAHVFPYKESGNGLENFLSDDAALGIGMAGSYFFPNSQSLCRKIGFVKVDKMIVNIPFGNRQNKFIAVMKHELGHMLGLLHRNDTIMHPDYDIVLTHPTYTAAQCKIISDALSALTQP